jgi:hypothetical protein
VALPSSMVTETDKPSVSFGPAYDPNEQLARLLGHKQPTIGRTLHIYGVRQAAYDRRLRKPDGRVTAPYSLFNPEGYFPITEAVRPVGRVVGQFVQVAVCELDQQRGTKPPTEEKS